MCNVYAMYSYEPTKASDGKQNTDLAPFQSCWDDRVSQISR